MKRAATGGAHRGPVGIERQRRSIRSVQVLLVVIAVGLLVFAGYSWGRAAGLRAAERAGEVDAAPRPSAVQVVVLVILGAASFVGALLLQGPGGVRVPTPARLDALAGRAQDAATRRAEEAAAEHKAQEGSSPETASERPGS